MIFTKIKFLLGNDWLSLKELRSLKKLIDQLIISKIAVKGDSP
jgi:hypothetical protein